MKDRIQTFIIEANLDELGEPEVFTWDLVPVVDPNETIHLDEHGLPKVGTKLEPGMILVGKIGKTRAYETERKPTDLEIHGLCFDDLRKQFGHLWNDASERVTSATRGEVIESTIEGCNDGKCIATVRVLISSLTAGDGKGGADGGAALTKTVER